MGYLYSTRVSFFQHTGSMPALLRRLYATIAFYPTLAWNFTLARILGWRRWWDFVDEHVIVGAYPFARDVASLHQAGVRAVVNTCEEYPGPIAEYSLHQIEQFYMPTTDFTHPKLEDVMQAVAFIDGHVRQGHTVYIHCKAGRARSATVAMAWLIKHRAMSAPEAQKHLLQRRPHINPHLTSRPVIQQFIQAIESAKEHLIVPKS
jgi:atypical dual specificity phosphatase